MFGCDLFLSHPYRKVGEGCAHNKPNALIHHRPIPTNHMKVQVDKACEPRALLPVPDEYASIYTVGEAVGAFVAWPTNLLVCKVYKLMIQFYLYNVHLT